MFFLSHINIAVYLWKKEERINAFLPQFFSWRRDDRQTSIDNIFCRNVSKQGSHAASWYGQRGFWEAPSCPRPDVVHLRVLKGHSIELAEPLSSIFKTSWRTGDVLQDWRRMDIISIFKEWQKDNPGYYRPFSLTPVPETTVEQILKGSVWDPLKNNLVIQGNENRFVRNKICELVNHNCLLWNMVVCDPSWRKEHRDLLYPCILLFTRNSWGALTEVFVLNGSEPFKPKLIGREIFPRSLRDKNTNHYEDSYSTKKIFIDTHRTYNQNNLLNLFAL